MMKRIVLVLILSTQVFAAEIVTDSPRIVCEEYRLHQPLKIYKDPSLFLPQLAQIYADPLNGMDDLLRENPLVTTLEGAVRLMKLGSPREFKNFGEISRVYELVDPRFKGNSKPTDPKNPMIIPVKICSNDSYNDTMGFVLSVDLKKAQFEVEEHSSLPPSAHPNPIPKLRKAPIDY